MNTVSWETWPGITLPSVELLLLVSRQTCVATCLRWKWHNLFIVHISCPQIWPSLGEAPQALCLLGLLPLLRCDCCRCRHQLLPCSSLSNAHHIIRMLITLINNSTNKFHPSYQALHWPLNTVTTIRSFSTFALQYWSTHPFKPTPPNPLSFFSCSSRWLHTALASHIAITLPFTLFCLFSPALLAFLARLASPFVSLSLPTPSLPTVASFALWPIWRLPTVLSREAVTVTVAHIVTGKRKTPS